MWFDFNFQVIFEYSSGCTVMSAETTSVDRTDASRISGSTLMSTEPSVHTLHRVLIQTVNFDYISIENNVKYSELSLGH